jgi:hypothetical protein
MVPSAWPLLALLAAVPPAASAPPEVTSAATERTGVALTIYNEGRGLVHETRTLDVAAGLTEVRFTDVAEKVEPATVRVGVVDGPRLAVLEQNYEYDLLTPQKLLEKFVGQTLTLVERRGGDGEEQEVTGTLLSTNSGTVWEIGGRIVTNPGYGRVVFPHVPENFVARPTLVWLVEAAAGGRRTVEAAYLTGGMSWRADYVLSLDAAETKAGLLGWVTMNNESGAGFRDAAIKLVAGDLRYVPPERRTSAAMAEMVGAARATSIREEGLFEYHLYTLPRRTTLADKETKQVQLLDAPSFAVGKEYLLKARHSLYRQAWAASGSREKVAVMVTFRNTPAAGLGLPIPKGVVRVYKRDASGASQFVGEDRVDHTARNEEVRLEVGDAFDIAAERRQTDFKRLQVAPYDYESAYEIRLRNRKAEPVVVRVIEPIGGEWNILESSHPAKKTAAFEAEFQVSLPPDQEAVVTYRVRVKH